MYSVSEEYKEAIRQRVVNDRIAGSITLSDGTKLTISDRSLVKNSLKISHELCDDYRIGTFHIGCLQIAVFDDNALLHDFSGARIEPVYEIETAKGWESVPMGIYYADGNSVRRKRNTVSLTAYDCGCFFDRVIPEERRSLSGNAEILAAAACADCGVPFGGIPETLPNYGVSLSAADMQIRTYRDMIAWCAELLCAYAVIDREGKLWFRSAKYGVSQTDNTNIVIDKYLTEEERDSIYVTDTRAYIRSICAYNAGVLKTYVSDTVQTDEQAAPAGYTFAENPLLPRSLNLEERDKINTDRLAFIDGFKQRGINAEIYGDPALDVGDVLRCSGGDIDQRRSIVGLVTKQEWRYRNFHTIVCAAPPLLERDAASAAVVTSQTDKKLDALSKKCEYAGGKGIEVSGNMVNIKPAKTGLAGDKDELIGGVWTDGYGVKIEDDGRIHLIAANSGNIGGVVVKDGLRVTAEGWLSVDPGKGMMYYTPDSASSASTHLVISPRLGDGLRMEPEEEDESDELAEPVNYEKSEAAIQINVGEGLEFGEREYFDYRYESIEKTAFTSKLRVKLGKGLSFGADGEINAAGGGEYKAGENITISEDGTISAQAKEYKAGKNITISDDGTIDAEGSGVTIDQAVIIKEADAKYLLHNFTEIQYNAGNKIGYAGPGNQIVVQGLIFNKMSILSEGNIGHSVGTNYNFPSEYYPSFSKYLSVDKVFYAFSNYALKKFIKMSADFVVANANDNYMEYSFNMTDENGNVIQFLAPSRNWFNFQGYGFSWAWDNIHPPKTFISYPGDASGKRYEAEFGFVEARMVWLYRNNITDSSSDKVRYVMGYRPTVFYFPFSSIDEYNAAVGLTYEPLTLTRVEDNPTVVSGKEVE